MCCFCWATVTNKKFYSFQLNFLKKPFEGKFKKDKTLMKEIKLTHTSYGTTFGNHSSRQKFYQCHPSPSPTVEFTKLLRIISVHVCFVFAYSQLESNSLDESWTLFQGILCLCFQPSNDQWHVNLGVKAMKEYSTFPRALELEPHHQIQFNVILRTLLRGDLCCTSSIS